MSLWFFLQFLFPQSVFALFSFSSTATLGLSLSLACLLGCSPAGHQALLHSSPAPWRGQETELSCLSWLLHQGNGRDCCRRQPWAENGAPVSLFLLESLCSAVHSGTAHPTQIAHDRAISLQGGPHHTSWGPRPASVICVLKCDTWQASCLQKAWQIFNYVRTFQ